MAVQYIDDQKNCPALASARRQLRELADEPSVQLRLAEPEAPAKGEPLESRHHWRSQLQEVGRRREDHSLFPPEAVEGGLLHPQPEVLESRRVPLKAAPEADSVLVQFPTNQLSWQAEQLSWQAEQLSWRAEQLSWRAEQLS